MKTILAPCFIFIGLLFITACSDKPAETQPPNIIIFLADDLGYGETGVYGQEKIKTPHIDALAESGMLFTQFYSAAPVCAPARYMLLTGQHAGHAYIRGNDEWNERGDVWDYEAASLNPELEGQRPMPTETFTLGKALQEAGYKTGLFGKWGLGGPLSESIPNTQGFDEFYGYNCQRQAHNLYPPHLWHNRTKDVLDNELIAPRTGLDTLANPNDPAAYRKYFQPDYAPAKIHDYALAFMDENKDQPFFMYYASPLPHVPLQIPQEFIDPYIKQFGEESPYDGSRGYFPTQYPRATYAAMISYLDQQLGELVAKLKELGLYENTIILFTSDNGPSYAGGVDAEFFNSAAPFDNAYGRTKGFVYEGGIRVPMIASWPGHIEAGSRSDHISILYDLMPTACELAGTRVPPNSDGLSFSGALLQEQQVHHDYLYWDYPEYQGQQAVRMGQWKGIRKNIFQGNKQIELYNLSVDPGETVDVSNENPDVITAIAEVMLEAHTVAENPRFHFPQLGDGQ
jgi:arylsulfatase A-like enzyme